VVENAKEEESDEDEKTEPMSFLFKPTMQYMPNGKEMKEMIENAVKAQSYTAKKGKKKRG
jgi:hypothetical protein